MSSCPCLGSDDRREVVISDLDLLCRALCGCAVAGQNNADHLAHGGDGLGPEHLLVLVVGRRTGPASRDGAVGNVSRLRIPD